MAAARRGLVWVSHQTLMIQPNALALGSGALSPLRQRGAGYRLPRDSMYRPLQQRQHGGGEEEEEDLPTAAEMLGAVNHFHASGAHPSAICFGGGHAEPLGSNAAHVMDALRGIRRKWHGTPLVLQTNGLCGAEYAEEVGALHAEWAAAPGSDGDAKLSVWVNLAASNPPEYDRVMQPGVKMGFQQVCGFISRLAEQQVNVVATACEVPKVKMKMVQQVAMGLGCSDFFARSYHPEMCYDVLGLPADCSDEEVHAGYLAKAKELHPDLNPGEDAVRAMASVTEAHGVLSDPELRVLYDNDVADLVLNAREEDVFSSLVNKSM